MNPNEFVLYMIILPHEVRFCTIFRYIFKENEKSQPLWLTFKDLYFGLNLIFQRKILYLHQDILCFDWYIKVYRCLDKIRERARHADGQERQWPKFLSQTREDNIGRTLSKDEFRWLVFMERGLEFAGENRRFFDLKRMRKDDNTMMYDYMMNTYIPHMAAKYPAFVNSTTVLAERKKWWPKPFTEVDRNPGVQQNPGY